MSPLAKSPGVPILCYVTDRKSLAATSGADEHSKLLRQIVDAAAAGVNWIQIREKDLTGREVFQLTRDALAGVDELKGSSEHSTRIIVNDRLDVGSAADAHGVHLGENSLPVAEVQRWLKATRSGANDRQFLVGVSCHSLESCKAAERDGADYLIFGPIFPTPAKAAYGAPHGLAALAKVCSVVALPVLAIGGITLENAASCLGAGARGIAAIRLFQESQDLPSLVRAIRAQS